jgi:hypothetical protein
VAPGTYRTRLLVGEAAAESTLAAFPETLRVRPGERIVPPAPDERATESPDTSSADGREPNGP